MTSPVALLGVGEGQAGVPGLTRRAPGLPDGCVFTDGDSAVVVATRDIRPREQRSFGAYQLWHADRPDLVRCVRGPGPCPCYGTGPVPKLQRFPSRSRALYPR